MQNGKISPPTAIFLAKNFFNYKDVADVVVTPNNPMQSIPSMPRIDIKTLATLRAPASTNARNARERIRYASS